MEVLPNFELWITSALSEAVAYLTELRITHGDIKLGNIFMDTGFRPVLGDFGLSRQLTENELTVQPIKIGGTKEYRAFEICTRDPSLKVDLFNFQDGQSCPWRIASQCDVLMQTPRRPGLFKGVQDMSPPPCVPKIDFRDLPTRKSSEKMLLLGFGPNLYAGFEEIILPSAKPLERGLINFI